MHTNPRPATIATAISGVVLCLVAIAARRPEAALAGGALVETSKILRPDTDLVLEILDSRTSDVTQAVKSAL